MYLDNFWRSFGIPLIRYKVLLKLKWPKHCVLVSNCNDSTDVNPDNLIFTIKDPKLYAPLVTLSAKDNQKLSKLLSEGL